MRDLSRGAELLNVTWKGYSGGGGGKGGEERGAEGGRKGGGCVRDAAGSSLRGSGSVGHRCGGRGGDNDCGLVAA